MPSKSDKQHNFMEMVAHDPEAAKRVDVPVEVGKEFVAADKAEGTVGETKDVKPSGSRTGAHNFKSPPATGAHGFGHSASQKQGHHRVSGTPGAHRIGKK